MLTVSPLAISRQWPGDLTGRSPLSPLGSPCDVPGVMMGASTGIVAATVVTVGLITLPTLLRRRGHDIVTVGEYDELMGHAGAVVRHPDGRIEGAADPRGDGAAAAADGVRP